MGEWPKNAKFDDKTGLFILLGTGNRLASLRLVETVSYSAGPGRGVGQ